MSNNKRTNWWQTIKRWFGLKAEAANDAMDNSVDIETKLNRKIKDLVEQREAILNNPNLSKALGLPEQLDEELVREKRDFSAQNYDKTIKSLMERGNKEQARQVLTKKKSHEAKVERIKEMLVTATNTKKKVQNDLDILDTNIIKAKEQLEELKQRNSFAQQSDEIYTLMNEIEGISIGFDSQGIADQIKDKEQIALGKRSEHERRNATATVTREIENSNLDAELDNYLK